MNSEQLIELIKQFAQKGHITESEKKILMLKAKSFDISEKAVDILIRQELEPTQNNANESETNDYQKVKFNQPTQSSSGSNYALGFGFIGLLLGLPVSYFFQAEKIRAVYSLPQYLSKLPDMFSSHNTGDFATPIVVSCIITTVIGALIGNYSDKNKK